MIFCNWYDTAVKLLVFIKWLKLLLLKLKPPLWNLRTIGIRPFLAGWLFGVPAYGYRLAGGWLCQPDWLADCRRPADYAIVADCGSVTWRIPLPLSVVAVLYSGIQYDWLPLCNAGMTWYLYSVKCSILTGSIQVINETKYSIILSLVYYIIFSEKWWSDDIDIDYYCISDCDCYSFILVDYHYSICSVWSDSMSDDCHGWYLLLKAVLIQWLCHCCLKYSFHSLWW